MELLDNLEDMLFLESQRKKGRPGCKVGIDKLLFEEKQKQKVKEKKLAQRLHRSHIEKEKLSEKAVLESSCCSSGSDDSQCESEDENLGPRTSTSTPSQTSTPSGK